MQEQGLRWHFMREIEERGAEAVIADAIAEALDGPDAIYLSVDIDVIDPGHGARDRDARAGRDADRARCCAPSARSSARSSSPAMDIVEVSPPYDHAETTAMAANRLRARGDQRARGQAPGRRTRSAGRADASIPRAGAPIAATAAALARLYDLDLADDPGDLDLYLALADRAGGPILELAVGTGRLAMPLAAAGHRVTGVDIDPAHARPRPGAGRAAELAASGGSPRARRGRPRRARASRTARRFGLAFIALNSLLVLPTRDRPAGRASGRSPTTSRRAGSRSSTCGCPTPTTWPASTAGSSSSGRGSTPRPARIVTKAGSAQHDAASGTITLTTIFEEGAPGRAAPVAGSAATGCASCRPTSCAASPRTPGLRVETLAGGYDLGPLGPGSERADPRRGRP